MQKNRFLTNTAGVALASSLFYGLSMPAFERPPSKHRKPIEQKSKAVLKRRAANKVARRSRRINRIVAKAKKGG